MRPAFNESPMMRAARRESVDRTPVWLMRQAGRYMAEYRAIRRHTPFLQVCKNPRLCAEIAVSAAERLKVDAAILFSDLLLILEPMGMLLEFSPGDGPVLANPLRDPADADRLLELESLDSLQFVIEAVRITRQSLPDSLPLIGFAGAPFTLAAYAVEGGSSRDYRHVKSLMYADAGAWNAIMDRFARAVGLYLNAQIDAGAQLVQLFDSWAGCLGADDYRRCVLPHVRTVLGFLPPDVPVIYFYTGNPALLADIKTLANLPEFDANTCSGQDITTKRRHLVFSIDWRMRLDDAWAKLGPDAAVQGNLDPAVLLATPDEIRRQAREILDQAAGRPGHIFNLGHGVLPQTPVENVIALVDSVHEYRY
jgi:uroporphyrinogen decarboxylase